MKHGPIPTQSKPAGQRARTKRQDQQRAEPHLFSAAGVGENFTVYDPSAAQKKERTKRTDQWQQLTWRWF